ncbi:MAG: hypothetical protein Q8J76_07800 [Desulfobulbaceae bacterium]|nr:hypothetical protein [Desulfobulbaceae bacterium]
MAWDKNEVVILGLALVISAYLTAIGRFSQEVMQGLMTLIVGYAAGRIFNQKQGKE